MRPSSHRVGLSALLLAGATVLRAQQSDSAARPTGRFLGTIKASRTKQPVPTADIRLYFLDSIHVARDRANKETGELFVDSTRSRIGMSDSAGAFAIRALAAGRYIINIRRLGLEPFQGLLNVDTGAVELSLTMTQYLNTLPAMRITESAVDLVKQKLERSGYVSRSRLGFAKTFVDRADVLRRKYQWAAEILATYGIRRESNPTLLLDNVPVTYDLLANYPADLVIGVEIYRHNLPIEFSTQRAGALALDPSGKGQRDIMRPTVVIWTFIP